MLGAALAGLAAGTAGCGVTLEQDAPAIPLLPTPTREPVPDEDQLLRAREATRRLAEAAAVVRGRDHRLAHDLAAVHRQQHRTLTAMLRRAEVPLPRSRHRQPPAHPTADRLARLEARAVSADALDALGRVTAASLPTLATLAAQRASAAALLGATPDWRGADRLPPDTAASLLKATRPAVYALQVVAARSDRSLRRRARSTLERLQVQQRALEAFAGRAAPPPPLGYQLPEPLGSDRDLRALARDALAPLQPAAAALLAASAGRRAEVATLVRLLAQDTTLAAHWDVPLAPFPGLTDPAS